MATSSETVPQAPAEMVQRNKLVPVDNPETRVFDKLALVNVPVPLTTDHIPPVAAVALKLVDEEQMD